MNYKYVFTNAMLGLVTLLMVRCDNYLDLKSDASLVIPKTLQDVQALLDDADRTMNLHTTPSFGDDVTDDYFVSKARFDAFSDFGRSLYVWKLDEYRGGDSDWARVYPAIYTSNLALELLSKTEKTTSNSLEWDNVKGSALFYRAFYFLGLTVQHGHAFDETSSDIDLGIVLRLSSDFNQRSVRSTVRECYEQVIADLEGAIKHLPNYPVHVMRPSKGAAYGLLARAYLYMRKYDQALEYTHKALSLNSQLMDFNGDSDIIGLTVAAPFKQFNKETIFYAQAGGGWNYTTSRGMIDTVLYASYVDGDLRKVAFFRQSGDEKYFKGNYTASASVRFGGITTNELYLMLAECSAFLEDVPGAMDALNVLLKKRWDIKQEFKPLTARDKREALSIVRQERRKELLIRNMRWIDIKRYNKEGEHIVLRRKMDGVEYILQPNAPYYALPLPADIVEMTGIPQN